MPNPFLLKFTLKQHTPIIHFQHDQAGATLRATEVKPKLDLFIMKKCLTSKNITWAHDQDARNKFKQAALHPGNDNDKKQWKNWLVGNGNSKHIALNYKLSFENCHTNTAPIQEMIPDDNGNIPAYTNDRKIKVKTYPAFFGNTGKVTEVEFKKINWISTEFEAFLICMYRSLKTLIEDEFSNFIFSNNFGSRQSKGFGSFTCISHPHKMTPKYWFDIIIPDHILDNPPEIWENYVFKHVNILHMVLRSGINLPMNPRVRTMDCRHDSRFYCKSILWKYANSKGIQWEKKSIKQHFLTRHPCYTLQAASTRPYPINPFDYSSPNMRLIKAMMGLSSDEQWKTYHSSFHTESQIKVNHKPIYARFKSPITYKPIRISENIFRIYILCEKVNPELYNKTFEISNGGGGRPLILRTPANNTEFDTCDFLNYAFEKDPTTDANFIILTSHIDPCFHSTNEFKLLDQIFNNIRTNLL